MSFMTKANRFDTEISESFVLRVHNHLSGFECHELWNEPCLQEFPIRRDEPRVLLVAVCILILYLD